MALNHQSFSIPFHLSREVEAGLERWRSGNRVARLWARDASLWTDSGEDGWLGWLDAPANADIPRYEALRREIGAGEWTDLLLLGMGGSVLGPAVFAQVFGHRPACPRLHVLDSVDPAEIRRLELGLDPKRTLVVASSKSGSTLETRILMARFLGWISESVGEAEAPRRFMAITDPGSALEAAARERGFRNLWLGQPDIGGRFSALSAFGLVPLAATGADVGAFIGSTMDMVRACGPVSEAPGNPGVQLGVVLGVLTRAGHDKLTLAQSPSVGDLALWLEQLLAESTGKSGVGILPVVGEELDRPDRYGRDRAFVYLRFEDDAPEERDSRIAALEESGQPVVRIRIRDALSIGQEMFRWEVASSVACAELGVNPFDQPDVEASKVITRELMSEYEASGAFSPEIPTLEEDGLRVFAMGGLEGRITGGATLAGAMRAFLGSLRERDYAALLSYSPLSESISIALGALRSRLGGSGAYATTVGFGPRYLHSSGQMHKGGPDTGAFLLLVSEDSQDLPVPGYPYTFGVVKSAQARADARALADRGRRVLRIEVGGDFEEGLGRLSLALAPPA
jgi:transaldolase/glucose-6-phosphate isomerase